MSWREMVVRHAVRAENRRRAARAAAGKAQVDRKAAAGRRARERAR